MRLTVVAAAPGYGKTSTVRRTARNARWCAGEAAADFIRTRRWAPSVVLDEPAVSFDELRSWLATTPCERVTVITREPLEGATLGPVDLALPEAAIGPEAYAATKGWPALAQLWPEHADYVRTTVLPSLTVEARRLVTAFAHLGPVRRALCTELGVDPVAIVELTRLGVLRDGALVPAVADGVDRESTVDQRRAASWYARNGFPAAAARIYHRLGLHRCLETLLSERGREVLEADPETFGGHPLLAAQARALATHHLDQANACLEAARYPEALRHADLAVRLTDSVDARICRGRVLGRLGRFEDALACFTSVGAEAEAEELNQRYGRPAASPEVLEDKGTRESLTSALLLWRDRGSDLDVWRVTVALGALEDASVAERLAARAARVKLAGAGIPVAEEPPAVSIRTLGRFDVRVGGVPVPPTRRASR